MSNSMFYTGLSGLNAAQAALVTTGHNTANVNTPGYSRQTAQISASGGSNVPGVGFFGNGAKVTDVSRSYDQYLSSQLNQAQSLNQSLTTYGTQISQIDNLLASQTAGLAPQMQTLFTNVQAVVNTPADTSARQQLISSGQALANQFRSMDQFLTGLNASVNDQISGTVDQINTYAQEIASLNKQVARFGNASGTQAPNDLLDQRDQLVSDLGKLVGTKVVVQDGGQFNVFIGNGQTLVLGGKATMLAAVSSASDASRTTLATVNNAGKAVQMQEGLITGGSLSGLLQFRAETLSNAKNSLGRIAISLADSFNTQQKAGYDLNGVKGKEFFSQASPAVLPNATNSKTVPVGVLTAGFAVDIGKLTTSDYRVDATQTGFNVTRLSDNSAVAADSKGAYDGLALTFTGGVAGDSFLIQPTRAGARDFAVVLIDPAEVAAASSPFTNLPDSPSGVSDGRNALLLGALQNKKTMAGGSASFNDAYAQLVSTVGNKARQVQISNTAQSSLTLQIRTAQQSVSGVNQDEETANLLMFQQMYQANAKVIQTASTMFDAVLGIR
ncbi:flagellar hook-associated protein FlgK [Polaromonas sp. DSR2-3-2]|uniref:flagellar hook-associated protein FlgK n=1 Tax=unclassified Polaromonas TaxID=2638319 RepID=UPI003CEC4FD2